MSLPLPHNFHPTQKVLSEGFVLLKVFERICYQKEQELHRSSKMMKKVSVLTPHKIRRMNQFRLESRIED